MKAGTIYLIRDTLTGLYSPGRMEALGRWRGGQWGDLKRAKVWSSIGALKNHLRQFVLKRWVDGKRVEVSEIPATWEVLAIEVTHSPTSNVGLAHTLIKLKEAP